MSGAIVKNCACPTPEVVEIPGSPGAAGTPGAAGVNAFTLTTADFTVPAISGNVAVSVANNSWMAVGQNIFVQGAGYFSVASLSGTTTVTLTYLNYNGNTAAGNTITAGAQVSPGGTQPADTLLPALSFYGVGGSQVVTATPSQALSSTVTLADGTYLLMATARYDYVGATFAANQTVNTKLRRTNNTAADIPDAVAEFETSVITTQSNTAMIVTLPPVTYAATAGDIIDVFSSIDVVPSVGDLKLIEVSLVAIKLF